MPELTDAPILYLLKTTLRGKDTAVTGNALHNSKKRREKNRKQV